MKIYKYVMVDRAWVAKTKESYKTFIKKNPDGWKEREPDVHESTSAFKRSVVGKAKK